MSDSESESRETVAGNAAAMREALEKLREIANVAFEKKMREGVETVNLPQAIWYWCGKALSAPARNCDVGTPEEQTQRMHAQLCSKQKSCYELPSGEHCPLHCTGVDCRLAWAQMPYEAQSQEGAGE